jgi:hypothetical protein
MSAKIASTNAPSETAACWFITSTDGDTAGYPSKKISSGGHQNRHRLHRVMHALKYGTATLPPAAPELAHRCRRGRYDIAAGINVACINPYHTIATTHDINLSHNQCANGCLGLCPHTPKCAWTRALDGQVLTCRLAWPMPASCKCGRGCF